MMHTGTKMCKQDRDKTSSYEGKPTMKKKRKRARSV